MILYEIALHLFAAACLPKVVWQMLRTGKYRESFSRRLGVPNIPPKQGFRIWLHSVSVGETKAAAPLVQKLQKQYPHIELIISSITETGHAQAKKSFPAAIAHLYLPLDFRYLMRPMIQNIQPDLVIITETDFWFNFLKEAKKAGAKIALINGKLSERSFTRFQKLSFFAKPLFQTFDLLALQNTTYKQRFSELGVHNKKIHVTGNLKLDASFPKFSENEILFWKKRLGISENALVFTCGSTHDPEEKILLDALASLWTKYPHLKVLLVPRHPERFDKVAELLKEKKLSFSRYSDNPKEKAQVTLVDAMGVLKNCYAITDLAFVGGTLTPKVGGHNIIEPSFYSVPVLFGPHLHAQPDFYELTKSYGSGELFTASSLERFLASSSLREKIGSHGLKLTQESVGCLDKTFSLLESECLASISSLSRDGAVVSSLGS